MIAAAKGCLVAAAIQTTYKILPDADFSLARISLELWKGRVLAVGVREPQLRWQTK
jgi:hypothetical protein